MVYPYYFHTISIVYENWIFILRSILFPQEGVWKQFPVNVKQNIGEDKEIFVFYPDSIQNKTKFIYEEKSS
jgi:hypothetical protein